MLLGHARPVFTPLGSDKMHGVFRAAHDPGCGADVIGNDPVTAFAHPLGSSIGDDIIRFRSKADNKAGAIRLELADGSKNIGVLGEFQNWQAA